MTTESDLSPLSPNHRGEPLSSIPGLLIQEVELPVVDAPVEVPNMGAAPTAPATPFKASTSTLINSALKEALKINPSVTDILVQEGAPIWFKCAKDTLRADQLIPNADILKEPLTRDHIAQFVVQFILGAKTTEQAKAGWERVARSFSTKGDFDESIQLGWGSKLRINLHRQAKGRLGMTGRISSSIPPALDRIGLPPKVIPVLRSAGRGLILITGPMSAGKTSTAQSLLNHRNITRSGHIVTIEDPIETDLRNVRCVISAKEVGVDVHSFADGLTSALRQAADCILIGEMRDKETIKTAINASASGVLVIATVHGDSCTGTITKLMGMLGEDAKGYWEVLAQNLVCVIRQAKVPADTGDRWLVVGDALINSEGSKTSEFIRTGNIGDLERYINDSRQTDEFTSMNERLKMLISGKEISLINAKAHSTNPRGLG